MIEVGTKLKSVRSGKVVEVLELMSGAKKVKLESGEVKVLNDANIARWYDEVVVEKKEKLNPPKKSSNNGPIRYSDIGVQLIKRLEGLGTKVVKVPCGYISVSFGNLKISQVLLRKKYAIVRFKESNVGDYEKKFLIRVPNHFRRSMPFFIKVKDENQMAFVLNFIEKIIKQEKK